MTEAMHQPGAESKLREDIYKYAAERMAMDPVPLDGPRSRSELEANAGVTISEAGIGGQKALSIFQEVLAPATISTDHPNFLSFIPAAPTEAATLFDLVVSASSIYGGSWTEGAGAVFAENQVLEFLAGEAGLPKGGRRSFCSRWHSGEPIRTCGRARCRRSQARASKLGNNLQLRGAFISQVRRKGNGRNGHFCGREPDWLLDRRLRRICN